MSHETLEALIDEKLTLKRNRAMLDEREEEVNAKLDRFFKHDAPAEQLNTPFGSIVRVVHEDRVLANAAFPLAAEALHDQFNEYFNIDVVIVRPTTKCLQMAADKRNPIYQLMYDHLIVKRTVFYTAMPASPLQYTEGPSHARRS